MAAGMAPSSRLAALQGLMISIILLLAAVCAAADGTASRSTARNAAAPAVAAVHTHHQQHPKPGPAAASSVLPAAASSTTASKGSTKPLWPLDATDLGVLAIVVFSLSLAGGAGIGGGAILVPVFLMLRGEEGDAMMFFIVGCAPGL